MAPSRRAKKAYSAVVYDIFLWTFTIIIDLFFREIHPRSTWRIPKKGPVIFVAAPHANQFVDPLLLMRVVRHDARRRIAFLVAEKSMRRPFIGFAAGLVGSVPVGRALDSKKPATGKIYLPDPTDDPKLLKGIGTDFTSDDFMPGGLIVLPAVNGTSANTEIAEILGPTELRLKKPFKGETAVQQLTGKLDNADNKHGGKFEGVKFSVAPHVDQSEVYEAVFRRIHQGGCIGIFPEGGSHDRTELLPLKAGLAIMALGALAENPDCGVTIVPVGMNYFAAHKFRSRAVIEFGAPISIAPEVVEQYTSGNRRDAIGKVLEKVYAGLEAVTVQAPDYDTLMLIQAVRRLYKPHGKKLPLSYVVELNRRLIKGYKTYKNDPRVVNLVKSVLAYNKQLFDLNIRDHQVSYARLPWYTVLVTLVYRLIKVIVFSVSSIPGVILFAPVFICGKIISRRKAKEALAASTVKVKARDVVATWKILVAMALAPTLLIIYTIILTVWGVHNRVNGWIPTWLSLWLLPFVGLAVFPAICFAALRFGEIGMDIVKSLRPLLLSLNPASSNILLKLRKRREALQDGINEIINELGPELFPDFDQNRIITDSSHPLHSPERSGPTTPKTRRDSNDASLHFSQTPSAASHSATSAQAHLLPLTESFKNIGSISIFASRPGTPNRARSRSRASSSDGHGGGGFRLQGFTSLEPTSTLSKPSNLDEVSKNLHEAMRERGRRRKDEDGWVIERDLKDEATTPGSEYELVEEPRKDV
ncbi:uncharacterized protein K489DRAFT_320537 [Dissoconium aciculare CBS 342.82]|uniref:Phospholipid/glycerol acyltransferase domain-containing protein n=1 Tax=Dissoconium aciculare CBS 342.82 TaxID=1314786 RepID=A0A6J3M2Q2_9PEZI|nr:uncharacterized protein K489DRAFT_320537 [Dissoconium aciculare CBS 342.82]KAF1822178.1 hypothetical protein K489DRAFT_320537 [Dissoconium aciculare CBS 342.82]